MPETTGWRSQAALWYLSRRMWDFLTKRTGDQVVTRSGYTAAPLWGIAMSLTSVAGGFVAGGWPLAAVGIVVLLFFMRSYERREKYAITKDKPDLFFNEGTMLKLREMEYEGQRGVSKKRRPLKALPDMEAVLAEVKVNHDDTHQLGGGKAKGVLDVPCQEAE